MNTLSLSKYTLPLFNKSLVAFSTPLRASSLSVISSNILSATYNHPLRDEAEPGPSFVLPTETRLLQLMLKLKKRPSLDQTKQVHAQLISQSLAYSISLTGDLIQCYSNCKRLSLARTVFDQFPYLPPTFLWNLIIRANSKTPTWEVSLCLFRQMLFFGWFSVAVPDKYTFTFVITACSQQSALFGCGQNLHGMVFKIGYDSDVCVGNSLVNVYATFSRIDDAQRMFDEMSHKDTITWTSLLRGYCNSGDVGTARTLFSMMPVRNDVSWAVMIAGYVSCGLWSDALHCFNVMLEDYNVKPNEAVLVSVLTACAQLGALDQGRWIHVYMDRIGVLPSSNISTALIDMYAKCGRIECAKQVFYRNSTRDILMWTSMIYGLAMHGLGGEALEAFSYMLAEGIKPDHITLLGVLNACSHSGHFEGGLSVFYNMERLWGIAPRLPHFGCFIDLLSRAGKLESAFQAAKSMPMKPDVVIWRALLNGCKVHGNAELGKRIMYHIDQLEPGSLGGEHVLFSNLHACLGQWEYVTEVRKSMIQRKTDSGPGCSYVEINGCVYEFLAADRLHPQIVEINNKLNEVMRKISLEGGYIPMTKKVLFDLSEEDKE